MVLHVFDMHMDSSYLNPELNIHGWSENFFASTIDGNTIGKIYFSQVAASVIIIHMKL